VLQERWKNDFIGHVGCRFQSPAKAGARFPLNDKVNSKENLGLHMHRPRCYHKASACFRVVIEDRVDYETLGVFRD
jgi:hypothetical protein